MGGNKKCKASLTVIQQELVEQNYDLIEKCLLKVNHKYRMDYYDTAAIKLCEIARDYSFQTREEFRNYAARSIFNKIAKEQQRNRAAKRTGIVLSLSDTAVNLEVEVIAYQNTADDMLSVYAVKAFYRTLNQREQRIVSAIIAGYTYEEIGGRENISRSRVKQLVKKMRDEYIRQRN